MARGWHLVIISKRLWLVTLALLAIPVLAEFGARLTVSRQLFEAEARLQREIEAEEARAHFLTTFEQYVQTDGYIEWWARNARMAKAGEIAVVPVTPADSENLIALPVSGNPPRDYVGEWWAAFFADLP